MAAKIVAAVVALIAIVSMIMAGVGWSPVAALLLMSPSVLFGGWMYVERSETNRTRGKRQ